MALPHHLQVVVTDKTPKGFDDPTTDVEGRTIFWPAAFSRVTHDVLAEFLPEVIGNKGAPRAISKENFTDSSRKETKAVRERARKDLEEENKVLADKIRQIRSGE